MQINKQSVERIAINISQNESNLAIDYCLANGFDILSMGTVSGTEEIKVIAEMIVDDC